jgi:hypothetical protein
MEFNTEVVRKGSDKDLPILAFVYDNRNNGGRYIRKEFVHDKKNMNYDYNYLKMSEEINGKIHY